MDALMIVNAADLPADSESLAAVELLLSRARTAQGVIVRISAPVSSADPDSGGAGEPDDGKTAPRNDDSAAEEAMSSSGTPVTEEDELVLTSAVADAFDGVEDLAAGLGDLQVDRLVVAGVDADGALRDTAMAGLALGFDVLLVSDACLDASGRLVGWIDDAQQVGAIARPAAEAWLRM